MENVPTLSKFCTKMAGFFQVVKGRPMGIIDLSTIVITGNKGIILELEDNVMPIINVEGAWLRLLNVQKELCLNPLVDFVSLVTIP